MIWKTIDSEAFADCDNLIKISLPLSVKSFENNSFSKGCLLCFANASDAEKTDLKNYNYKNRKNNYRQSKIFNKYILWRF